LIDGVGGRINAARREITSLISYPKVENRKSIERGNAPYSGALYHRRQARASRRFKELQGEKKLAARRLQSVHVRRGRAQSRGRKKKVCFPLRGARIALTGCRKKEKAVAEIGKKNNGEGGKEDGKE